MIYLGIYLLFGIVAHWICRRFLRRREPSLAGDLNAVPLFGIGFFGLFGLLLTFAFWPLYIVGMVVLMVWFPDRSQHEPLVVPQENVSLIGATGTVETDLTPIGKVRIGDQTLEALSMSGLVETGDRVKVVARDSLMLKVVRA